MNEYKIHDPVFGAHHINEPLLIDLLQSSAVKRLQGIHQSGASYLVRSGRDTSRYNHVIGVMLLIRALGGSLEEQVAGLIHDISHTAFSHVVDQVFQRRTEDYHDQHFNRFILSSDIPEILKHYGIAPEEIFNIEQWSLLERPMPDLCADRIDYTLRDLLCIGKINLDDVKNFLHSLDVYEGKIATTSLQAAVWFVHQYGVEVRELFMNPLEIYANYQLAKAIRVSLDKGILKENDLFGQDEDIMRQLHSADDPEVTRYLAGLRLGVEVVEDEKRFDVHAYSKARIVDPLVLMKDGSVVRCSTIEPSIKELHSEVMLKAKQGIFVRVISIDHGEKTSQYQASQGSWDGKG
jgi:HD superfamily phosphohydrolase